MENTTEIKKLLTTDKLVIGTNNVLKGLRQKLLKKIFISKNCPADVLEDIEKYAKMTNTELVRLDIPNEELGTICKKPFFVSLVGVKNQ